jgi:hypothetical protein
MAESRRCLASVRWALLAALALQCLGQETYQRLPVINPSFEFPVTTKFSSVVVGWESSAGAGVFRYPLAAYPKGVQVSWASLP